MCSGRGSPRWPGWRRPSPRGLRPVPQVLAPNELRRREERGDPGEEHGVADPAAGRDHLVPSWHEPREAERDRPGGELGESRHQIGVIPTVERRRAVQETVAVHLESRRLGRCLDEERVVRRGGSRPGDHSLAPSPRSCRRGRTRASPTRACGRAGRGASSPGRCRSRRPRGVAVEDRDVGDAAEVQDRPSILPSRGPKRIMSARGEIGAPSPPAAMSRARKSANHRDPEPLRNHVAVADLQRRPPRARYRAVVVDRLPMRADQVDVRGRQARGLEGLEGGPGEVLTDPDIQLGDRGDIQPLDVQDLPPHVRLVWMLTVMQQLD